MESMSRNTMTCQISNKNIAPTFACLTAPSFIDLVKQSIILNMCEIYCTQLLYPF